MNWSLRTKPSSFAFLRTRLVEPGHYSSINTCITVSVCPFFIRYFYSYMNICKFSDIWKQQPNLQPTVTMNIFTQPKSQRGNAYIIVVWNNIGVSLIHHVQCIQNKTKIGFIYPKIFSMIFWFQKCCGRSCILFVVYTSLFSIKFLSTLHIISVFIRFLTSQHHSSKDICIHNY